MNYLILAFVMIALVGGAYLLFEQDVESPTGQSAVETMVSDRHVENTDSHSPTLTGSQQTLDLSGQGLTRVPDSAFDETDIETFDVSNNNLDAALQAEIRHLQNLRILDLSDNNFTGVPAEIGQLAKLELLDLSNNPITGLPHEIGNLKKLKVLDLRGTSYAKQDLDIIRQGLSSDIEIRVD